MDFSVKVQDWCTGSSLIIFTIGTYSVQGIRIDNGGEFCNDQLQALLKDLGIVHYRTCAYTP